MKKTIMLETNSDVFADIIKSIMKKYSEINGQMEGSGSSFKFVSSLNIWWYKINAPKGSSYGHVNGWDLKMPQQIKQILMTDVFSMLLYLQNTMKKEKIMCVKY